MGKDNNRHLTTTNFVHARDFVERKWPDWAPASRRNSQRELARAVLDLVDDDAPDLTGGERVAADGFLRRGCG